MNVLIEQNIISTSIISITVEKFILISHKIQQKPHLLSLSFYWETFWFINEGSSVVSRTSFQTPLWRAKVKYTQGWRVCKVLKLLHLTTSWSILHTLHSWELWITLSLTILITVTSCPYCGVCDLVPRTDQRPGIPGREIRNFGPSSEISSEDSGSERRGGENRELVQWLWGVEEVISANVMSTHKQTLHLPSTFMLHNTTYSVLQTKDNLNYPN